MTKEEAFEKLELPIGSDLQSIRKKFASMHNDYRMQIDNAFNLTHKHNFEQKLEELKEAYTLLNESDGIDDSADLPRTGRNFEEYSVDVLHATTLETEESEMWTLDKAMALFGLDSKQNFQGIRLQINTHLSELNEQLKQVKLASVQQVYQQEILKAKEASLFLENWMNGEESYSSQDELESNISIEEEPEEEVEPNLLLWYRIVKILMITAGVVMLLIVLFNTGRLIGAFGMCFSWSFATLLSSVVILNFHSSPLVPPFFRKGWLKGGFGLVVLLLLLFGVAAFTALLFTIGARREANPWIHWSHYEEIGYLGWGILFFLWLITLILCLIIGVSHPKTLFFNKRSSVIQVIVLMIFYQFFLIKAIPVGFRYADFSVNESENYADQESLLLDSVYSGVTADYIELNEIDQLKKNAEEGDAVSQYTLGYKYENGEDVEKNLKEAVNWYIKASDQGYEEAQVSLGWCYDNGLGVKKDEAKAHGYYLTAAENGNAIGQYNVGCNYLDGIGTKVDRQRGISYWKRSALQGNEDAIKGLKEMGITDYKMK